MNRISLVCRIAKHIQNTNSPKCVPAALFGINRFVDFCFLADMFIQALLGFLDRKRQRWETRPRKTIKRYCKRWLVIDTLSVLPYDAVVVLIPSHDKLKVTHSLDRPNAKSSTVLTASSLLYKMLRVCPVASHQELTFPSAYTQACFSMKKP